LVAQVGPTDRNRSFKTFEGTLPRLLGTVHSGVVKRDKR
jgi:hypothetical protein